MAPGPRARRRVEVVVKAVLDGVVVAWPGCEMESGIGSECATTAESPEEGQGVGLARYSQGRRGEDYVTSANSIDVSLGSVLLFEAGLFVAPRCSNDNDGLGGGSRHDKTKGERLELTERLAELPTLLL